MNWWGMLKGRPLLKCLADSSICVLELDRENPIEPDREFEILRFLREQERNIERRECLKANLVFGRLFVYDIEKRTFFSWFLQ